MKLNTVTILTACAALLVGSVFGADADEIIRMKRAGVSDDVMLAYIDNSNDTRELSDADMRRLEDEGVSASVIVAMADRKTTVAASVETRSDSPRTVAEPVAAPAAEVEYVQAPPKENLNISFFYDSLSSHGKWQMHADYGWVWQPSVVVVERSWRPYCDNGHWVWTNQGWYWESDYPWGWAAFHYGRWYHDARIGWVWRPGTEWAPAWVHWRESHTHYGWAPLPPEAEFHAGVGFSFRSENVGFNFHFGLNESHYAFVPCDRFLTRNVATVAVPRRQVTNIYNNTTIVNNTYVYNDNRVINQGVPQTQVAARTRQKIETVQISDANVSAGQTIKPERRDGQKLTVYRPQLAKAAPEDPPTVISRKQQRAEKSAAQREQRQERQQAAQQANAERREARMSEAQAKKRLDELKRGRKIVKELDEQPKISASPTPQKNDKREQKAKDRLEDIKRSREVKAQPRSAPEAPRAEPKASKEKETEKLKPQAPAVQRRQEASERSEAAREERKVKVEAQREERQEKADERREQQRERQDERRREKEDRKNK